MAIVEKALQDDYAGVSDPKMKGNIFEQLGLISLERRYRRRFHADVRVGNGTYIDAVGVGNKRTFPIIAEFKHRKQLLHLRDGNTEDQLPRQIELALSNGGLYEIVVASHTYVDPQLIEELKLLTRKARLNWKISVFDPAKGKFKLLYESKGRK